MYSVSILGSPDHILILLTCAIVVWKFGFLGISRMMHGILMSVTCVMLHLRDLRDLRDLEMHQVRALDLVHSIRMQISSEDVLRLGIDDFAELLISEVSGILCIFIFGTNWEAIL